MDFVFHDGGRAAAGYKGMTGDCVARSIAIATGKTYLEVYDALDLPPFSHPAIAGVSLVCGCEYIFQP